MRSGIVPIGIIALIAVALTACAQRTGSVDDETGHRPSASSSTAKSGGNPAASSPPVPTGAQSGSSPSPGSVSASPVSQAGLAEATRACRIVSGGLSDGSIGVPANPAALAPAKQAAQSAQRSDSSWSELLRVMDDFIADSTAAHPDVQQVNRDLAFLDAQCAPIGAPMPSE